MADVKISQLPPATLPLTGAEIYPLVQDGVTVQTTVSLENLNVRQWGAVGDGVTDDTVAIQTAINVGTAAGNAIYFPNGNYRITSTLTLPTNSVLIGENKRTTYLTASGKTFPVLDIIGQYSEIRNLYIRGGSVGIQRIKAVGADTNIVDNCQIQSNRIGILLLYGYIGTYSNNFITNNDYGVVCGQQSFQTIFQNNRIDGNLGGLGIMCFSSSGLVITGNTIEGNRNQTLGGNNGVGLVLVGLNQRTVIRDNYFEANGLSSSSTQESTDILLSRPDEAWVDTLVETCIPTEYQSQLGPTAIITGEVTVEGAYFYGTKRGITLKLTNMSQCAINISNLVFIGTLDKYNIGVDLYGSAAVSSNIRVNIDNLAVLNTATPAVTPQMLLGVKNSPIYQTGTPSAFGVVTYNGEDLYTAYLTTRQVAALSGMTFDVSARVPSSGTSYLYNGAVKAVNGTRGVRVVQGTGRPRAGAAAWFTIGNTYRVFVLGTYGGAWSYVSAAGTAQINVTDSQGYFNITQTAAVTSAEATFYTGSYVGYAVMTEAQYTASALTGCVRLIVKDLDMTESKISAATTPTGFASAASYLWSAGDIVYNDMTASTAVSGWVCTVGGTGATSTWVGMAIP